MRVWSLGQEDSLEEEMATYSSILAWRIPRTEEPGKQQSMGLQRVRHDWATEQWNWRGTKNNSLRRMCSITQIKSHQNKILNKLLKIIKCRGVVESCVKDIVNLGKKTDSLEFHKKGHCWLSAKPNEQKSTKRKKRKGNCSQVIKDWK